MCGVLHLDSEPHTQNGNSGICKINSERPLPLPALVNVNPAAPNVRNTRLSYEKTLLKQAHYS